LIPSTGRTTAPTRLSLLGERKAKLPIISSSRSPLLNGTPISVFKPVKNQDLLPFPQTNEAVYQAA
jgi:hypothetical protein